MDAFVVAYDEENKRWVKRPCTTPREVTRPRERRVPFCTLVTLTLQAIVGLWILSRLRNLLY